MPFAALKGFMPLNTSELFKEDDIQLAQASASSCFPSQQRLPQWEAEKDL